MFHPTGVSHFDKYLEKATSNLLLEVDLFSVLAICDLISQKDCPAKYAIAAIKKKLAHQNPYVVFYTLQTLESIVKNCGSLIHEEVANKEFMEYLKDLAESTPHENVRDKILELIQTWDHHDTILQKVAAYLHEERIQDMSQDFKEKYKAILDLLVKLYKIENRLDEEL